MSVLAETPQEQAVIQERLRALQTSVLERKNRIDGDLHRESGPIPANFSDQATAVENDESLLAIKDELTLQLSQINHALQRLESGGYGVCERCHQDISDARLEAIPATSMCIHCASTIAS